MQREPYPVVATSATTRMPPDSSSDAPCALADPRIRAVLDRLHAEAGKQTLSLVRLLGSFAGDKLRGRHPSVAEEVERLKDLYVPVSPKQGRFLYLVARSLRAQRIVEFGTSFGISTTYLAAAVRDNGGGVVIGSELETGKVAIARRNIDEAGLRDFVEIREGDAQETLKDPGGTVDMVLLDGFKQLYLPMLKMLAPGLRQGAVVLADNIFTFRYALASYVAYVQDPAHGFCSVTLFLGDGMEYSVRCDLLLRWRRRGDACSSSTTDHPRISPALIAGLLGSIAMVWVGPPLSARPAESSSGSRAENRSDRGRPPTRIFSDRHDVETRDPSQASGNAALGAGAGKGGRFRNRWDHSQVGVRFLARLKEQQEAAQSFVVAQDVVVKRALPQVGV
jgi:predicted O-methyltransferase YrrM